MAGKPPGNEAVGTVHSTRSTQQRGSQQGGRTMAAIRVHEFISLDSVIDTPSWTFQFGFDPRMGEAIGRITMSSDGILLGRTTYEMFEPTWSKRTAEEDPGAPFFNETRKYVVSSTLMTADLLNDYPARLAARRRVITVELQGHGHTRDIGRPLRYELLADDIAALLDHLGLARADLVGYSLGAGVALQVAMRHPGRVRCLAAMSVTYRSDGLHPEMTAAADPGAAGAALGQHLPPGVPARRTPPPGLA